MARRALCERTAGAGVVRNAAASSSTRYEAERPERGAGEGGGAAEALVACSRLQPPEAVERPACAQDLRWDMF